MVLWLKMKNFLTLKWCSFHTKIVLWIYIHIFQKTSSYILYVYIYVLQWHCSQNIMKTRIIVDFFTVLQRFCSGNLFQPCSMLLCLFCYDPCKHWYVSVHQFISYMYGWLHTVYKLQWPFSQILSLLSKV